MIFILNNHMSGKNHENLKLYNIAYNFDQLIISSAWGKLVKCQSSKQ